MSEWHKKHRKHINEYNRKWRENNREKVAAKVKKYAKEHPEIMRGRMKRYRDRLKHQLLLAYGNKCSICGTDKDLTVDHVNGDGAEHRKRITHPLRIWADVRRQGFPKDKFRLLCRSCNTKEWYRLFYKGPRRIHTCPKCGHKF